uniref:Uncharacterized protein n=1 Tax=Rhodopseudomonas palustris (strain BisA53) TaxID=316055 RepID=Q07P23_RHOP5
MRQSFLTGLAAVAALVTVSAAPAMACGGGFFASGCSPCGQAYVAPPPCGGPAYGGDYGYGIEAEYERLPDPSPQYFYVDQGPTYSGPGMFAPRPYYREATVSRWSGYGYRHRAHHRSFQGWNGQQRFYGAARSNVRYGHVSRQSYGPRYGAHRMAPRGYAPRRGHHPY